MRESLGLVETRGISTAIQVADVMVKAANVKILELENSRGSGYMTVKIVGDVGAVKAAVQAAKAEGMRVGNLVSASVIARPSDGMASLFCNPKVPYQSVNKKPVPQAWEDEKPKKKAVVKKDEPKKAEPKKAEPKKAEPKKVATSSAKTPAKPAPKPEPVKKVEVKKPEPKQEPKKPEVKAPEPAKVTPAKAEPAKKVEPKKAEAPNAEPKKEAPKTVSNAKKASTKRKK